MEETQELPQQAGPRVWWLRRPSLAAFLLCLPLYLATTSWDLPVTLDPLTNTLTAWKLGTSGSVVLPEYQDLTGPNLYNAASLLVETAEGPVSKYPPGTALLAAPAYALVPERRPVTGAYVRPDLGEVATVDVLLPEIYPGSVVAVVASAAAVAVLTAALVPIAGAGWALAAGLLTGLGTSMWTVSSDALWQHGPATMWLALGLWAYTRRQYLAGSTALGLAVITRPQTAIIAAVVGVWLAVRDRSWRTLFQTGFPAALGALAYVAFNRLVFDVVVEQAAGGYWVEGATRSAWVTTVLNLWGAFFDPLRGVFVWTPLVAVALLGLRPAWRAAPDWARAAAVGAVVYLVIQVRGNGFSGGDGFFSYRYQLEAVFVAVPLLTLGVRHLVERSQVWKWAALVAAAVGVGLHLGGALLG